MTLKELKAIVDAECVGKYENYPVCITLAEKSIGARWSCAVKDAWVGSDWQSGKFRIEPEENLCRKERPQADEREMVLFYVPPIKQGGKNRLFLVCPKCDEQMKKDYKYCPRCGQRVKYNADREAIEL